jgi:hypothetical protein
MRRAADSTALIDSIHAKLDGKPHRAGNAPKAGINTRTAANEECDVPSVAFDHARENRSREGVTVPESVTRN